MRRTSDLNQWSKQVVAIRNRVQQGLGEVAVPADRAAEYARFVELIRRQTSVYERLVKAAVARDVAAQRPLAIVNQRLGVETRALGGRLGMSACAG